MMSQEAFDVLDETFDLVPEEDLENGCSYQWVCNHSGGRFYTLVTDEQYIWLNNGI